MVGGVDPGKVVDTISGPEMVSDFDSLSKSVILAKSQARSSGCSEPEDASRAWHGGSLGPMPILVSENQLGAPEAPLGRLVDAFLRKGRLPNTMKYAIVHLLLKLKIFSSPVPRTSLTTVQRSILTIQGGGD